MLQSSIFYFTSCVKRLPVKNHPLMAVPADGKPPPAETADTAPLSD